MRGLGLLRRVMPVSDKLFGQKFFTLLNGKRPATPLLAALVPHEYLRLARHYCRDDQRLYSAQRPAYESVGPPRSGSQIERMGSRDWRARTNFLPNS